MFVYRDSENTPDLSPEEMQQAMQVRAQQGHRRDRFLDRRCPVIDGRRERVDVDRTIGTADGDEFCIEIM